MDLDKLNGLINSLKCYGFAIISNSSSELNELLHILKSANVMRMLNVRRIGSYTILEVDGYSCERDCIAMCKDTNGKLSNECFGGCMDSCTMNKLETVIQMLSSRDALSIH